MCMIIIFILLFCCCESIMIMWPPKLHTSLETVVVFSVHCSEVN